MHKAVCADCGQECEVPFKPDGSRPYTAENVMPNEDDREDIKLISQNLQSVYAPFSFFCVNSNNKQNAHSSMRLK